MEVSEDEVRTKRRARAIVKELGITYPDARCELDFSNPFQLLVATIVSAQSTDQRVNGVTPALFSRFPTAVALAAADRAELEDLIRSTGFFRAKAQTLQRMAQQLCDNFSGDVPARLQDLITLAGVGRKTANVVLGDAFGVPGVTVDTHVGRLARRFGWTSQVDPEKVEAHLMGLFPRKDWTVMSHRVIWHGRRFCHARRPACGACSVARWCPAYGQGPTDPAVAATLVKLTGRR
jgi:endonuclease-3